MFRASEQVVSLTLDDLFVGGLSLVLLGPADLVDHVAERYARTRAYFAWLTEAVGLSI